MPTEPSSAAPASSLSPAARARVAKWMDALLDLSQRNPLVSFRREGRRVLPIAADDVALLENAIADGLTATLVPAAPEGARERRRGSTLAVSLAPEQVYARAVELDREARKAADEGGAWNLYMAIGLLAWKGAAEAKLTESPVLLVPVALQIDRTKREARLVRHDDETLANPALVELLRREFGVTLEGLKELPEDDFGVDVERVFASVRAAVAAHPDWSVREEAFVARFAFDKIVMWKDLRDHGDALVGAGLAARLADPNAPLPEAVVREQALAAQDLDARVPTASLPLVVDADSSQLAAVELAQRGGSFVLEGPPGTGKSQTITNIVAALLAKGKRVLFVSEKMAALRVVHHRLGLVGLDAACLELHAHAAAQSAALRRGVLVSLDEGWTAIEGAPGEEASAAWTSHAQAVDAARVELNGYVRALHAPLPIGLRFREALARRVKWRRRRLPLPLQVPPAIARGASEEEIASVRAEVERFSFAAARVSPAADHPLFGCTIAAVDAPTVERIIEAESDLREGSAAWEASWAALARSLGEAAVPASEGRVARLDLLEAIAREVPPVSVLEAARWPALRTDLVEAERAFGDAEAAHRALMERWSEEIYAHVDLAPKARRWATAFVLFAWFALWAVRRTLAPVARGALPDRARVAGDLEAAIAQRGLLEAAGAAWARLVGTYAPRVTERAALVAGLDRAEALRARCAAEGEAFARVADALLATDPGSAPRTDLLEKIGRAREALRTMESATDTLESTLRVPLARTRSVLGAQWLAALPERLARWSRLDESVREWAAYQAASRALEGRGLGAIVRSFEEGRLDPRALPEGFADALADLAASTAMAESPALGAFDGERHAAKIAGFRASEREAFVKARGAVLATLKARAPRRGHAASAASELGVLERELRKKVRHMPVRRLLRELPTLLPRLKPCLLMSPLSVAQYLPPKPGLFDCVVFDEASQITVPDAIGAIARASQVIVVGDTKQMPPSSFFQKLGEAGEADEAEDETPADLESILDEVAVAGVPRIGLRWHYRSRHEALIAFSNAKYYGARLETFPSAAMPSEALGVRRTYLADGTYTGAGRNEIEAKAVVAALLERLRATAPGSRSFGVVTFGLAQQSLVEDLLDEARGADPAVEAHFADALPEPVFVKNLENVQGDERDEILFSTTYGPGERRVVRQNFGPLSRSGGARRLNVAITRARRKLHVFTSMRAADIVVTDAKSDGVRDLEAFLRYLERGAVLEATGASAGDAFDSDFEREVYDELRALGHEVHTQVGVGAYRIDLGVVDPRVPGRYLLGVECDGAAYHSGATARDRDRLRQEVLEGLGWRLFRVWSTDWWARKAAVMQRLRAALEEAVTPEPAAPAPKSVAPASVAPAPRSAAPASVAPAPRSAAPASAAPASAAPASVAPASVAPAQLFAAEGPFEGWLVGERRVHRLPFAPRFNERLIRTPDDFFDDRVGGLFVGGLEAMLERGGPLGREEAARLVLEASGFKRMSSKWTARVDTLVAASAGRVRAREGFLWAGRFAQAEHAWVRLRADGEARDLEAVPREEIATAALVVLGAQGAMPLEDLEGEIAKLFGHARPRGETLARAAAGVELARGRSLVTLDGRRVMLA